MLHPPTHSSPKWPAPGMAAPTAPPHGDPCAQGTYGYGAFLFFFPVHPIQAKIMVSTQIVFFPGENGPGVRRTQFFIFLCLGYGPCTPQAVPAGRRDGGGPPQGVLPSLPHAEREGTAHPRDFPVKIFVKCFALSPSGPVPPPPPAVSIGRPSHGTTTPRYHPSPARVYSRKL